MTAATPLVAMFGAELVLTPTDPLLPRTVIDMDALPWVPYVADADADPAQSCVLTKTLAAPDSGNYVMLIKLLPGTPGRTHWHLSDTLYIVRRGELNIEGEGVFREGSFRWVKGGFAYGPETPDPREPSSSSSAWGPTGCSTQTSTSPRWAGGTTTPTGRESQLLASPVGGHPTPVPTPARSTWTRSARRRPSGTVRWAPARSCRPRSIGSSAGTGRSTQSSTGGSHRRWRSRGRGRTGPLPSVECPSWSRTRCAPPRATRTTSGCGCSRSAAGARLSTRTWPGASAQPASSSSAGPTPRSWPPRSAPNPPPTVRRPTRGTWPPRRADPVAGRPRWSPPGWSRSRTATTWAVRSAYRPAVAAWSGSSRAGPVPRSDPTTASSSPC